jgi:hypothetical protein
MRSLNQIQATGKDAKTFEKPSNSLWDFSLSFRSFSLSRSQFLMSQFPLPPLTKEFATNVFGKIPTGGEALAIY